jgi:hypothetical protein
MYPLNPKEGDFNIEDIAHALSLMTRANGHFRSFYSVAQHCINCSLEGEKRGYSHRLNLALLLHDASEAYLSDLTRPVKISLTDYNEIERNLQTVLFRAMGVGVLTLEDEKLISVIDDDMLYYEFERLHVNGGFEREYNLMERYSLDFCDMKKVEETYLERYFDLQKKTGELK